MAARKGPTAAYTDFPANSALSSGHGLLEGWKYRPLRLGPFRLPWYASPESQLVLVSFVCFLCPGEATELDVSFNAANNVKECSMLLMVWVVKVSVIRTSMPVQLPTPLFTPLSPSLVSLLAPLPTLSVSDSPYPLVVLDIASISALSYATITPTI